LLPCGKDLNSNAQIFMSIKDFCINKKNIKNIDNPIMIITS